MAQALDGGGGSSSTIDRKIKRSTSRGPQPGTVRTMRASDASNQRAARAAGYKPRSTAQLKRAPIHRPTGGPGTVSAQARSAESTRAWAATSHYRPRSVSEIADTPVHQPIGMYGTRVGHVRYSRAAAAGGPIGGVLRVLGATAEGVAQETVLHPINAVEKGAGTLLAAAKAIPATAELAGGLATYPVRRALRGFKDPKSGDAAMNAADELAGAIKEHAVDYYGDVYQGKKGAAKALRAKIHRDGPLVAGMDLATVAAPLNVGLGASARGGALGAAARNVATRKTLVRYGAHEVVEKGQRRTAGGIAAREVHNAVRRHVQKRRVNRAQAKGEGLPLHRALLEDDEVTPLSDRRTARRQRYHVAADETRGRTATRQRLRKHVSAREGGLIHAQRMVAPEHRPLVAIARQLGIRKAADVAKIVPDRLAEIERARADAAAKRGEYGAVDAKTLHEAQLDLSVESGRLQAILKDPSVFDRPDVQASIVEQERIMREAIGGREGHSEAKLAAGRTALQGRTVGVKPMRDVAKEERAAHAEAHSNARAAEQEARALRDDTKARVVLDLGRARAHVAAARARADVKGPHQPRRQASLRKVQERLAAVQERAANELSEASTLVRARTEARQAVAKDRPIKRAKETPAEYAARVDAAFAERGLAAPGYATSRFAEAEDPLRAKGVRRNPSTMANPDRHARKGTNYRLGNQGHQPETEARVLRAQIERGGALETENNILQRAGFYFNSKADADTFIKGLGAAPEKTVIINDATHIRRDTPGLEPAKGAKDHGDYVAAKGGVWVVPKPVYDEIRALGAETKSPVRIMRRLAHAPQTALLALSPSWFIFQRVNDLVGMAAGGSLFQARALRAARAELRDKHPDAADIVELWSGGTVSSDLLTPMTGQKLGRTQRALDENPTLRAAWNSDTPASDLLQLSPRWNRVLSPRVAAVGAHVVKKGPTALLRADAKITSAARELQYIQNLQRVAAKMDPDVKRVNRALGPMGHALKTGDVDLIKNLLENPKWAKAREEAAESLNRVMGDWHNFTAAERSVKDFAAFYGFLRYSTRMLLYTLPVDAPMLALTIAQLGNAQAAQTRAIIGNDLPYGLGKLFSKDGKIVGDLTRANPLTGPLTTIDKPEKLIGLASPLAAIAISGTLGINVGLSDSSTGFLKQLDTNGDPKDTSLAMSDRLQILADQTLSLLSPYKMAKNTDPKVQTADSLVFHREHTSSPSPATQSKIDAKNASAGEGGWKSVLSDAFPMFFADDRNWKAIGERATEGRIARHEKELDNQAARAGAKTPLGRAQLRIAVAEARITAKLDQAESRVKAAEARVNRKLLAKGIAP